MAPSKLLLLLGLAFVAVVLISSEAVSARELAETTQTGKHSMYLLTHVRRYICVCMYVFDHYWVLIKHLNSH